MKQPLLKAGTVATIVHLLLIKGFLQTNCWTGLDWTGMDWKDSSTTMEHACSRIQSYISKQLLLEAPGMLHTH